MEKWRICKKNWEKLNYSESTSKRQAFSSRALHIFEKTVWSCFSSSKKRSKTHVCAEFST